MLYGEHDKHLAQIEHRLGVSLISRGNHLSISGPVASADIARSALDALYRRLTKGQLVEAADVDAAVDWRAAVLICQAMISPSFRRERSASFHVLQRRRAI